MNINWAAPRRGARSVDKDLYSFVDELRELLNAAGVEFEEKYLP
jgi:hypothetical protein